MENFDAYLQRNGYAKGTYLQPSEAKSLYASYSSGSNAAAPWAIATAPKPVLAAINGFALGGGLELAMACHLRIAAPTARLGQPEVNLGLIPGYGGTQRLVEWVGRARALEMLMSGDPIDAATALQWGLVNRICATAESLLEDSTALLNRILQRGPIAVSHCIRLTALAAQGDPDGYLQEIETFGSLFQQPESREGIGAFLEKRKAAFRGSASGS
jgi:enoyl-CoA hydratase